MATADFMIEAARLGPPGGVRGLLAELRGEPGRLLLDPPAGRREHEAHVLGKGQRGLEVEELGQVGDGDEAARDLLG